MKKFIIMTTAITRPKLHQTSIKKFYDNYYLKNKTFISNNFDIYHIINIDSPEKLKSHSTVEETIKNFDLIIPNEIHKIYIKTTTPSFCNAYINIMNKIKELDLLSEDNYYWWFEDDWELIYESNIFEIINILSTPNCAFSLVNESPLLSFRGGPIMNGNFFSKYFNLVNKGKFIPNVDPERQVSRYMRTKRPLVDDKGIVILRELDHFDKKINIIFVYFNVSINEVTEFNLDFYKNYYESTFTPNIAFNYYFMYIENFNSDTISYVKYNYKDNYKNLDNYLKTSLKELKKELNDQSISHFTIMPFSFVDCGRDFAKEHKLVKWVKNTVNNGTYK